MKHQDHSSYYAGIGSRETPQAQLTVMAKLAWSLGRRGFILRSGAADGADSAFECGADQGLFLKEIWLPWSGFNGHQGGGQLPSEAHYALAETIHPAWSRLSRGPRSLHARNTGQILGVDLKTPVSFVVCYTKDGAQSEQEITAKTGGTGTALRLAARHDIPIFNLRRPDALDRLKHFVSTHPTERYHVR